MERKPRFTAEGIRHATVNGHRLHLRLTDPSELNPLWIDGQSPPLLLDQVAGEFVAHLIDAMWRFQAAGDASARSHASSGGDASPRLDEAPAFVGASVSGSDRVRDYVVEKMYARHGRQLAFGGKRVTRRRIRADLDRIFGTIMAVAEGGCPVEAGLDMREISVGEWSAPARMDLAVTYRCNLNCPHCYVDPAARSLPELSTDEWLSVYDVLWKAGVPSLVFTGGEPTLRDDLVRLVSEADEFVTGLVTNGTTLVELAEPLRAASLDYVQVTIESHDPAVHNRMVGAHGRDAFERTVAGIKRALELGMQVVTNTTLTRANAAGFVDLLRFGRDLGLKTMSCNTIICSGGGVAALTTDGVPLDELKPLLEQAIKAAQELGVNLQWYSPTCYLHLNPVELGLGAKGCSAAAHNMTVQPDGTVLPCQSWPDSVGNILADPWEQIWQHPTCIKLREHGFAQENAECRDCIHNAVCGGGCPLELIEQAKASAHAAEGPQGGAP